MARLLRSISWVWTGDRGQVSVHPSKLELLHAPRDRLQNLLHDIVSIRFTHMKLPAPRLKKWLIKGDHLLPGNRVATPKSKDKALSSRTFRVGS